MRGQSRRNPVRNFHKPDVAIAGLRIWPRKEHATAVWRDARLQVVPRRTEESKGVSFPVEPLELRSPESHSTKDQDAAVRRHSEPTHQARSRVLHRLYNARWFATDPL